MKLRTRIAGLFTVAASLVLTLSAPVGAGPENEPLRGAVSAASFASRTTTAAMVRDPWTATPCPEMTDSILRLYSSYFGRQPEESGFEFWVDAYSGGGWNLDLMSRQFSVSDEFVNTYGELTNSEFIDLIYQNIQGRPADPVGGAFWLGELDAGRMTRGRVMIFFSESEEYVTRSETIRPMAGYLGWYPVGTTWGCAGEPGAIERSAGTGFADILINNFERSEQRYTIITYNREFAEPIVYEDATVPADSFVYYRGEQFLVDDGFLEFDLAGEMYWVVVDYPTPMVEARPGWD